jgi:hypothetical protein
LLPPINSVLTIQAAGCVGGGTTRYPIKLLAPNGTVLHNVSIKQAAVTDTVGFALLSTTALTTQAWNGNIQVWVNETTSAADINMNVTIYNGVNY